MERRAAWEQVLGSDRFPLSHQNRTTGPADGHKKVSQVWLSGRCPEYPPVFNVLINISENISYNDFSIPFQPVNTQLTPSLKIPLL